MGKFLWFLLVVLLIPAVLYSYWLYEKAYLKAEVMTLEHLFSKEDKKAKQEVKKKNNNYEKNLFKEYSFVRFFQKNNEESIVLWWVFAKNYAPSKVQFRACDSEEKWATYEWKEVLDYSLDQWLFRLEIDKNNICPSKYYFKFENKNSIDFADYELFIDNKKFNETTFIDIFKFYWLDLENFETQRIDNSIQAKISKQDCEKISKAGKFQCDNTETIAKIELIWWWIFKAWIYNKKEKWHWFERLYDFNRQKEIFNNDENFFIKMWDSNQHFKANFKIDKLITNQFIYNVKTWEISDLPYDLNLNLTHFYTKNDWKIEIIDINSFLKTEIIPKEEIKFTSNFVFNKDIFALVNNNEKVYYYWKNNNRKIKLENKKDLSDISNNCSWKINFEVNIKEDEVILTWKCEKIQNILKLSEEDWSLTEIKNP